MVLMVFTTQKFMAEFKIGYALIDSIPNMNNWDMSKVTQFNSMFLRCATFNQDLDSCDISSGTNLVGKLEGFMFQ